MSNLGRRFGRVFGRAKKTEKQRGTEEIGDGEGEKEIYLKAITLHSLDDLEYIKNEMKSGNVLIIRFTPLAKSNVEDVKIAINDLYDFTMRNKGDMARLGKERIVITPNFIRIWREKKQSEDPST